MVGSAAAVLACARTGGCGGRGTNHLGPDLVERPLVERHEPAFRDPAVLDPVAADGLPFAHAPAQRGAPARELEDVLVVGEGAADGDAERPVGLVASPREVVEDRVAAAVVAGDRVATGDVPGDVVGEQVGDGLGPGLAGV